MVLIGKGSRVREYKCLCQTFVLVTIKSINIQLGGSFGVRYSDWADLSRYYIGELVKKTRVMYARYKHYFRIDRRSNGNDNM